MREFNSSGPCDPAIHYSDRLSMVNPHTIWLLKTPFKNMSRLMD